MRIAHITDTHLLESDHFSRSAKHMLRVNFLSFGRAKDAADRRYRLLRAICQAEEAGATHFLMAGDMTEDGLPSQYESFTEVLAQSGVEPERITLVPGNQTSTPMITPGTSPFRDRSRRGRARAG